MKEWIIPCFICAKEYKTVDMNSYGLGQQAVMLCKDCGNQISNYFGKQMINPEKLRLIIQWEEGR